MTYPANLTEDPPEGLVRAQRLAISVAEKVASEASAARPRSTSATGPTRWSRPAVAPGSGPSRTSGSAAARGGASPLSRPRAGSCGRWMSGTSTSTRWLRTDGGGIAPDRSSWATCRNTVTCRQRWWRCIAAYSRGHVRVWLRATCTNGSGGRVRPVRGRRARSLAQHRALARAVRRIRGGVHRPA